MKKRIIFFFSVSVISTAFISCKEDDEAPHITFNSPVQSDAFHWGDTIHASITFEDNKNLYSFGVYMGEVNGDASTDWAFSVTNNLSGKEYTWEQDLVVPDSIPATLYLQANVTDAATHYTTGTVALSFEE